MRVEILYATPNGLFYLSVDIVHLARELNAAVKLGYPVLRIRKLNPELYPSK